MIVLPIDLEDTVEIIKSINEFSNINCGEGFIITTNKQKIEMYMDMAISTDNVGHQELGYFIVDNNIKKFIGARILDIKITNIDDHEKDIFKAAGLIFYDRDFPQDNNNAVTHVKFININTTQGLLKIVFFNVHNGWWAQDFTIELNQITYEYYV